MGKCSRCGKDAGLFTDIFEVCSAEVWLEQKRAALAPRPDVAGTPAPGTGPTNSPADEVRAKISSESALICGAIGVLSLAVGLYYLLLAPGTTAGVEGPSVVNLHRLYIGQTFTIVGAVFVAAAIRPRG